MAVGAQSPADVAEQVCVGPGDPSADTEADRTEFLELMRSLPSATCSRACKVVYTSGLQTLKKIEQCGSVFIKGGAKLARILCIADGFSPARCAGVNRVMRVELLDWKSRAEFERASGKVLLAECRAQC